MAAVLLAVGCAGEAAEESLSHAVTVQLPYETEWSYAQWTAGCFPPTWPNPLPTDGNPYQCVTDAPPELDLAPGTYTFTVIDKGTEHNPSASVWVGDATGGEHHWLPSTVGEALTVELKAGKIVLYTWDWGPGDNNPAWKTKVRIEGDSSYRLPFVGTEDIGQGPGCGNHRRQYILKTSDGKRCGAWKGDCKPRDCQLNPKPKKGDTHPFEQGCRIVYQEEAIDYSLDHEPVYAANDGLVVFAGMKGKYGNIVQIEHDDGLVSFYAHLSSMLVSAGLPVRRGDPIAISGDTGGVPPHLHFELRRIPGAPSKQLHYREGGAGDPTPRTLPTTTWIAGDPFSLNLCQPPGKRDGFAAWPPVP